jgi:hypothetical protein
VNESAGAVRFSPPPIDAEIEERPRRKKDLFSYKARPAPDKRIAPVDVEKIVRLEPVGSGRRIHEESNAMKKSSTTAIGLGTSRPNAAAQHFGRSQGVERTRVPIASPKAKRRPAQAGMSVNSSVRAIATLCSATARLPPGRKTDALFGVRDLSTLRPCVSNNPASRFA